MFSLPVNYIVKLGALNLEAALKLVLEFYCCLAS